MRVAIRLLIPVVWLLASPLPTEARTFTDKNGRTLEAELVSVADSQVTLNVAGKTVKVALERFSDADQKYIRESFASGKKPQLASAPPQEALDAGYRLRTFFSDFHPGTVDTGNTKNSGFQWYPWSLFGKTTDLRKIRPNADGSLTLLGDVTGPNGQLCTAVPKASKEKFVGTVFGGGAYIEATLRFTPRDVIAQKFKGWPSWWSLCAERAFSRDDGRWPGQAPGYMHGIEVDFMEYDLPGEVVDKGRVNSYGACMHETYGIWNVTCKGFCKEKGGPGYRDIIRSLPNDVDLNQYHRYGVLWVPATPQKKGFVKYYFDAKEVGRGVSWEQYADQAPPPAPPWLYSILDRRHLILILGTGLNEPMTAKSVSVWQQANHNNWRY